MQVFDALGGEVLGIVKGPGQQSGQTLDTERVGTLVELLIERRSAARQAKDFATSDQIRDKLTAVGILLKDRPDGTDWGFK